ncbi:MAG: ABC transporter ATP-binding protein [archaeon GB-1867-005]|nr:ABC transporter ATP-binding protein [Candidatus Culexmicrobium cathedralense]
MKYIIEVQDLVKTFNSTLALNGLSFKAPKGVIGFIGPNGAGKTTTIKILLGLIRADSGSANILGFDCWRESFEIKRRIGVLHEKVAFYDFMSGFEYLLLVAKIKNVSSPREEVVETLKLVELDEKAWYRQIKGYSAGMKQRLGLAQALIGSPELIILDEPTSNLDPLGRMKFLKIIEALHREREINFLISSHILPELQKVCNYVILIDKGRAIKTGFLDDLIKEISYFPFRIKAYPLEPLASELQKFDYVKDVSIQGDYLIVKVLDKSIFLRNLILLAARLNVTLEDVKLIESELELLFKEGLKNESL